MFQDIKCKSLHTCDPIIEPISADVIPSKLYCFFINLCCQEPPSIQLGPQERVDTRGTSAYGTKVTPSLMNVTPNIYQG